ncbi:MAG: hypothetical protein IPM23_20010 [Candidatus Melainabacteria bacterium]|nr:hypothetical protein [Candidatus Melainabacteria bacterium]
MRSRKIQAILSLSVLLTSPLAGLAQSAPGEPVKNILAPAQPILPVGKTAGSVESKDSSVKPGADPSPSTEAAGKGDSPPEVEDSQPEPVNSLDEVQRKLDEMLEIQKQKKEEEAKRTQEKSPQQAGKEPAKAETRKKSPQLFGRIEQIAAEGDVKMPKLQAMTPQLDPRDKRLQAQVDETMYSGTIAKQFPTEFQGQWGGVLQIWSYAYSPLYVQMDRAQVVQSAKILQKGRSGNVNFNFRKDRFNRIALEPAAVLLSVPMKDLNSYDQMMAGGMSSQLGPFAGSFQQVMAGMEVPAIKIYFGEAATDGVMQKGVSGNQFRQTVVRNTIRQLSADVVEQQIMTRAQDKVASTGKVNTYFDESVMRFKRLNYGKLYVTAASVKYDSKGRYLSKLIMYGTVDKGRLVQTDPMSDMNKMMGSMTNLQQLQGMFGGGAPGQPVNTRTIPGGIPQMPAMPNGFNPYDILKKMNQQPH